MNKKFSFSILVCLSLFAIALYFNSSLWFRMRMVDSLKSEQKYKKAIQLYNKIIRFNSLKKVLEETELAEIYFNLGMLYAKLNLRNMAIESYKNGLNVSEKVEFDKFYLYTNLEIDKLLVIGLLESGRWSEAMKELVKLKASFPYHTEFYYIDNFINAAKELMNKNLTPEDKDFLFSIGDSYISNNLFDEGREFFTKRILNYGIEPLEVLSYLMKKYSENSEVRQKIWNGEIYVTLEDFENSETQLHKWLGINEMEAHSHRITDDVAYNGNYSEFLDIDYFEERKAGDYDFWIKAVKIPLTNNDLKLGVRFFICSFKPVSRHIAVNLLYTNSNTSGIIDSCDDNSVAGSNWKEFRIEDLYARAQMIAHTNNWDAEGIIMDKIMFNSQCYSGQVFIDEIQLFLVNDQPTKEL